MKKNNKCFLFQILLFLWAIALNKTALSNDAKDLNPPTKEIEQNPSSTYEQYFAQGMNYFEQSHYAKAKEYLQKAIELDPNNPDPYLNLSTIHIYENNFDAAIVLLKKAESLGLDNNEKKKNILYNLGISYYKKGEYVESSEYYIMALDIDPYFQKAKHGFDLSYQRIGEEKPPPASEVAEDMSIKEKSITKKVKKPCSTSEQCLKEAFYSFKNKNREEAIKLIEKSISLDPKNAIAYYRLGLIYIEDQNLEQAINYFNQAIETDPNLIPAYINLGGIYGTLKQYNKALNLFQKAAKIDKTNPKIYHNIGMVYAAWGKNKQAIKYFKKAKSLCIKNNDTDFLEKINQALNKIKRG